MALSSRQSSGVPTSPFAIPLHPTASGSGHATDDYVDAIVAFSQRATGEWLQSGLHYRPFARWLEAGTSRAATPAVDSTRNALAALADNFCFAIAVDLNQDGPPQQNSLQMAEPLGPGVVGLKMHAIRPLHSPSDLDSKRCQILCSRQNGIRLGGRANHGPLLP